MALTFNSQLFFFPANVLLFRDTRRFFTGLIQDVHSERNILVRDFSCSSVDSFSLVFLAVLATVGVSSP